jgi:hypothetical protein
MARGRSRRRRAGGYLGSLLNPIPTVRKAIRLTGVRRYL